MPGTYKGGLRAAATNIQRHGPDFYRKLGAIGGKWTQASTGKLKGFALDRERASRAGRKGGAVSRRRKKEDV